MDNEWTITPGRVALSEWGGILKVKDRPDVVIYSIGCRTKYFDVGVNATESHGFVWLEPNEYSLRMDESQRGRTAIRFELPSRGAWQALSNQSGRYDVYVTFFREDGDLMCQVSDPDIDLQCDHEESGGYRCEVIGPHTEHWISHHTISHALLGNGFACEAVEPLPGVEQKGRKFETS